MRRSVLGLVPVLAVLVAGCAIVDFRGSDATPPIRLVNATDAVVHYAAWERETSYRMDPVPSFPPDAVPLPALQPGASAVVHDVVGYEPGDDVVFLLYTRRDGADRVTLEAFVNVTARALSRDGGRVRITEL